MGKYIIELEDKPFHKEDGDFLYRVKGFNSLVFDMTGISKLAPYHEPDLGLLAKVNFERGYRQRKAEDEKDIEQVRKEAYEKGFDAGRMLNNGKYEKGINDAWEAARKIIRMPEVDLLNLFTECYSAVCTSLQVFLKYDASECIEKIRQYEQNQEKELGIQGYFKNGEEVIGADGTKAVILRVSEDNYCQVYTEKGCIENWHIHTYKFHKTGRHFPEIAAVFEKMREGQE